MLSCRAKSVFIFAASLSLFCGACWKDEKTPSRGRAVSDISAATGVAVTSATVADAEARGVGDSAESGGENSGSATAPVAVLLQADWAATPSLASKTSPVADAVIASSASGAALSSEPPRPIFRADDPFLPQREAMIDLQIRGRGVDNPTVLAALRRVPRHEFVRAEDLSLAYADQPLIIGHGQTISQPYIVGYMTELLALRADSRVLEVGTGSGYQAAIAAEIAREVVSIEIIDALARPAAERLRRLGYRNITVLSGDGYFGWPPAAPYDAIIVTAAAEHVPPPLLAQLKLGGRMAIPVGRTGWTQNLLLVEKLPDGKILTRNLLPVRFVPLTRERR